MENIFLGHPVQYESNQTNLSLPSIVRAGDAIYVRVGDHDLTQKFGSPGAQTLRVATTYIHHNHNSQTLDNDIALLKLHGEADLKEGVCLVCLPARGTSQATGKKCTVTGYGYMGESKWRLYYRHVCVVGWWGGWWGGMVGWLG